MLSFIVRFGLCAVVALSLGGQVEAQDGTANAGVSAEQPVAANEIDVDALIARVRGRLERIDQATRERDEALRFLENQIDAATNRISGTGETNEALRSRTAALNTELEDLAEDRERLSSAVNKRDETLTRLEQQIARLEEALGTQTLATEEASRNAGDLELELAAQKELNAALEASLDDMGAERANLLTTLDQRRSAIDSLANQLASLKGTTETLEETIEAREATLEETRTSLETELLRRERDLAAANALTEKLSDRVGILARQLSAVETALAVSETQVATQQSEIVNLGERLNIALAKQVEELSQYRSEFFGKLKQALGQSSSFRVVGDRFVFPSEVLFASGSARIGTEGQEQLEQLARALNDVASKIPAELDWILRIDGHTDRVPITNSQFDSNWELSTARAIAVVRELIERGVPAYRLAATGFGEFQPLDDRDDPEAYSRNRRIEFKLTSS